MGARYEPCHDSALQLAGAGVRTPLGVPYMLPSGGAVGDYRWIKTFPNFFPDRLSWKIWAGRKMDIRLTHGSERNRELQI